MREVMSNMAAAEMSVTVVAAAITRSAAGPARGIEGLPRLVNAHGSPWLALLSATPPRGDPANELKRPMLQKSIRLAFL